MKKYDRDKILEQNIIDFLNEKSRLGSIVKDCLYYHSDNPNHVVLKKRNVTEFQSDFSASSNKCLELLKSISNSLSSKEYSNDHIAAHIYLDVQKESEYFTYNIRAALFCLMNYLKQSLELVSPNNLETADTYMDNPLLQGKLAFISELLIDLSTFMNELYGWKKSQYEIYLKDKKIKESEMLFKCISLPFAIMRKRSSSMDVLQNVRCSIERMQFYDNIDAVPVAMFQIRQMIELRLWEIFDIDYIIDNNRKIIKLTADKLLDIPGLEQNVNFHAKLSNIKLIHAWTNIYVHAGISSFHWHIYFAYDYLLGFVLKPAIVKDNYIETLNEHLSKNLCSGDYRINHKEHNGMMSVTEEQRIKEFENTYIYKK